MRVYEVYRLTSTSLTDGLALEILWIHSTQCWIWSPRFPASHLDFGTEYRCKGGSTLLESHDNVLMVHSLL